MKLDRCVARIMNMLFYLYLSPAMVQVPSTEKNFSRYHKLRPTLLHRVWLQSLTRSKLRIFQGLLNPDTMILVGEELWTFKSLLEDWVRSAVAVDGKKNSNVRASLLPLTLSTNTELCFPVAFKVYDVDRDGYISNGELFLVLKMMVGSNLKARTTFYACLWIPKHVLILN